MLAFLARRRGRAAPDWTDWFTWGYLAFGLVLMFGPVVWLVLSSFKSEAALLEFPPSLLPYGPKTVASGPEGKPLPVFLVRGEDGRTREMVEVRRIGLVATMVPVGAD